MLGPLEVLHELLVPCSPAQKADELLVPASDGLVVSCEATSPTLDEVL